MANPSAGLLVFWLFSTLISIFPTRSWIQVTPDGLSSTLPILKLIFTILAFLVFILENIPKPNHKSLTRSNTIAIIPVQPNPSPEPYTNFFKRITFFWLLPLLRLGKTRTLRMGDLYNINPKLLSYPLYLTTKARLDADEAIALEKVEKGAAIKKAKEAGDDSAARRLTPRINLTGTIFHTVGYTFMSAAIPRIFYICVYYVRPILFSQMVAFVASYTEKPGKPFEPHTPWKGFGYTIAVVAASILSSLFDGQFQYINYNSGLKARSVFVTLVYRKSLRLSTTNKQEGMGSIVNHMSTDVDKVVAFFDIIHLLWSAVVELIITIVLLYKEVRYAIFASIGVVAVMFFLGGLISPFLGKNNKAGMKASDRRMKLINELVGAIKSIKLYGWEEYFVKKITEARDEQLKYFRRFYSWITVFATIMNMITPFVIFVTLAVYGTIATADAPLDSRRIFTTITLINMLQGPLGQLSDSMSAIVTGKVAFGRLRDFLNSEEIDDTNVVKNLDPNSSGIAFEVTNGTFGWYTPEAIDTAITTCDSMGPVMHDVNLQIRRGALTAVVGRVGEGKSSLVGALLGEMHKYSGEVRSFGTLAYVSQSAWILNASVRDNILFGRPYDKERYLKTIRSCALVPDFKMLVSGDKTVIGEKGINLSGGQKQRISIARAVYANADVYILDDPLSAVDAHVDHHIFKHALNTILADKTRILVTNGVNHLKQVDQIIVIKQGRITQDGVYDDLIQNVDGDLYRLIQESKLVASKEGVDGSESSESSEVDSSEDEDEAAVVAAISEKEELPSSSVDRPAGPVKRPTFKRAKSSKVEDEEEVEIDENHEVDEEITSEGRVGWEVYKYYMSSIGFGSCIFFVLVILINLSALMGTQLWLDRWGADNSSDSPDRRSNQYWIMSYFGWVVAGALTLGGAIGLSMVFMALRGARFLHAAMLRPLVRAPMSFFDVTSSGKIVNRFSHDINSVDLELPLQFTNMLFITTMAISIFSFAIIATRWVIAIMVPMSFAYYWLGGFFLVSSRELKRLDLAARSPMYAHFGETLAGLVTIRAFNDTDRLAVQATALLDRSQTTAYLTNMTNRWLQIMIDQLSTIILGFVCLMAVIQRGDTSDGYFGIILSQIGVLTNMMSRMFSTACMIQTSIVAVERIREYANLTPEARDVIPDSKTNDAWPQNGAIELKDYSVRYREGLDLVLKDINVTIQPGERVGIVGRTGAGKSSVTLALFRIIEAAQGSIVIDGIDISTLGLHELRSRLTIIPQEPFLFGDTIRLNLDPFGKHTDAEIWSALESASLKSYITTLSEGLSTVIENGGENMSLGQRQLMSLARSMLAKNTRVLCLDEATAAIDVETDNAIQRALRREFQNCTVLTIAHRINTIMDSDKILVLDQGRVAEFDSPASLLQKKDGLFFSLAEQSGNA
ncbi:MAG: P-loop containing nucleoside triphosphate hydrolase protein [Linnemannia gamsii]|nr:MAG: P-loop containing nucleoside triphosphate hydrolase protein [Linnemannia gamsii]